MFDQGLRHHLMGLISLIYCLILAQACTSRPPPPPPSVDPTLEASRGAFSRGDWASLKKLSSRFPSAGSGYGEALFYQAVLRGVDEPKRGLALLSKVEGASSPVVRPLIPMYSLIFQAISGECLTSEGALRKMYWPKAEEYGLGTRTLMQRALKHCDTLRTRLHKRIAPPAQGVSSESAQSKDTLKTQAVNTVSKDAEPTGPMTMTRAQREATRPHISLILPRKKTERPLPSQLILEIAPILISQREQSGLSLTIDVIEVTGKESISEVLEQVPKASQVLLAFTTSKSLHKALISTVRTQARPIISLSPFSIKREAKENIWRAFTPRDLMSASLSKIGHQAGTQRVGAVSIQGRDGERILKSLKTSFQERDVKWAGQLQVNPEHNDWKSIAKQIRRWNVDSLVIALDSTHTGQLVTYLGAQGVWSAPRSRFNQDLVSENEKRRLKSKNSELSDQYVRYLLWPTAYTDQLLNQAGRYVEGARVVTPVVRDSEPFKTLNLTLEEEVERSAHLSDALLVDLIDLLDEAMRRSEIYKRPLLSMLFELGTSTRFLPSISFDQLDLINTLHVLEVHQQRFRLWRDPMLETADDANAPEGSRLDSAPQSDSVAP